ncbi:transaldolase [Mucilaginibacter sabulilitoris]|uniref:Transaldolase n=1 Tax=Mucilaginibacter sabulilitoris TaxID=1173583 RepID=A0ABZ0TVH4_9SPHI|nr:transaldolase [Mucilaginibacter sabulilitoris]WPU96924.1 transaldolase [Mucilaginibacter sabulilitoris]
MEKNKLLQIGSFGQSIWLDFIDRDILRSGKLASLIEQDGVKGITSNPAIFEKAISSSDDYADDIAELLKYSHDSEKIFYQLAVKDIQTAADLFRGVYCEKDRRGYDGYVSLEVSPFLANDTEKTIRQAVELWQAVDRENLMIKIPGTQQGVPAVRRCIASGININITLLFSLDRYSEIIEAYISGLEERLSEGKDISKVASVASFFLSRIDVVVDPLLKDTEKATLKGKVAVASAKIAYQKYKAAFNSDRWNKLADKGAMPQRLLWASTGTKNPEFKDTKYIEELIGPETVTTVPVETLAAFKDHGNASNTLETDIALSQETLDSLSKVNITLSQITQQLEDEGIHKFNIPFGNILRLIDKAKGNLITTAKDFTKS